MHRNKLDLILEIHCNIAEPDQTVNKNDEYFLMIF